MFLDFGFWLICLLPLIVPWAAKMHYGHTITLKEIAIVSLISVSSVAGVYFLGSKMQSSAIEILNGQVLKTEVRESKCRTNNGGRYCRNSYSCNCVTTSYSCGTSDSPRTCTTTSCDTCYRYPWERSYFAVSNIADFEISRIDRQGAKRPPRWELIKPEDPVSLANRYDNYIKAVPESVFNLKTNLDEETLQSVPDYPDQIYDYYKVDRVLFVGQPAPSEAAKAWNKGLQMINGELGPTKQSNVILMFVNGRDRSFENYVLSKWVGGNKNDIILMIGVDNSWNITWTEVFSWAKFDIFNVSLRTEIESLKTIDINRPNDVLSTIYTVVQDEYVRRPMEEFEYLKDEIDPPLWSILLSLFLGLSASIYTTYRMHTNWEYER